MGKEKIVLTDDGFVIVTPKATHTVLLDEVNAIVAYKIDELTTDLVCCDIVTRSGDGEQVSFIHEEVPGFDALMASFETLPDFNRQWREAVILPPFTENRTTIYKRATENA